MKKPKTRRITDKERLDWLWHVDCRSTGHGGITFPKTSKAFREGVLFTLRQAIDAAIRAEGRNR